MIIEIIIICIFLYAMFGGYVSAWARVISERAHAMEIENDRKEME
jgi:hypothetical protein